MAPDKETGDVTEAGDAGEQLKGRDLIEVDDEDADAFSDTNVPEARFELVIDDNNRKSPDRHEPHVERTSSSTSLTEATSPVAGSGRVSAFRDELGKSGKRLGQGSFRTLTPKPGDLTAIIKSPAYQLEELGPISSFGRTTSIGNATAAQLHAPTPAAPVKFTLGRVFDDTAKFDDLPLLDAPNSWRIAGIAVWGGQLVNGIRITYERGGVLKSSRELVGYDEPPHEWEQIELRPGEEIVKIEAVISQRVEKLTFRTSQSRHGTFGRGTAGEIHELSVPHEHRLVAFHGGVGGSLHNFGFWCLPLPTSFLASKEETQHSPSISLLAPHERPGFIAEGGQPDSHIPIEKEEVKGCQCVIQ